MGRASLCALLLLLLLEALDDGGGGFSGRPEGEACLGWRDDREPSEDPFQCLKEPGGKDAPFCCGTCDLAYCCSSEEYRLDQAQCASEARKQAESSSSLERTMFIIIGMCILMMVVVTRVYLPRFCYWFLLKWGSPREAGKQNPSEDADPSFRLSVIDPPSSHGTSVSRGAEDQESTSHFPPPYGFYESRASCGAQDPQSAAHSSADNDSFCSYETCVSRASSGARGPRSISHLPSAETPLGPFQQADPGALEPEETNSSAEVLPLGTLSPPPVEPIFIPLLETRLSRLV